MGLYPIDCSECGKPFMWFSGILDQRCGECSKPQSLMKEHGPEEPLEVDLKATPLTPEMIEEAAQKAVNDCETVREQPKSPKKIR